MTWYMRNFYIRMDLSRAIASLQAWLPHWRRRWSPVSLLSPIITCLLVGSWSPTWRRSTLQRPRAPTPGLWGRWRSWWFKMVMVCNIWWSANKAMSKTIFVTYDKGTQAQDDHCNQLCHEKIHFLWNYWQPLRLSVFGLLVWYSI